MTLSIRTHSRAYVVSAIVAVMMLLGASVGWAQAPWQQRSVVTYQTPAENSKYTQQLAIDIGDVPGHQIRLFEIQSTYPKDAPVFLGVRVKNSITRGQSDYIGADGRVSAYVLYFMDNGDRIYGRYEGTSQGTVGEATGRRTVLGNTTLTSGSGKFRGIRGTLHSSSIADPSKGFVETKNEGVYWLEKE